MAEVNPAETYILNYFSALDSAKRGKSVAEAQAWDKSLPESEQAAAAAAALDLMDEIARLKSAHEAFMATFTNINPPSPEIVARAVQLSTGLAQDIAQSKQAVAILEIVKTFVDGWAKLSQGSPSAPQALQAATLAGKTPVTVSSRAKTKQKANAPKASTWLRCHS